MRKSYKLRLGSDFSHKFLVVVSNHNNIHITPACETREFCLGYCLGPARFPQSISIGLGVCLLRGTMPPKELRKYNVFGSVLVKSMIVRISPSIRMIAH